MHSEEDEAGLVVQASHNLSARFGLPHRLDQVTSGILLLTTSAKGLRAFSELLRNIKSKRPTSL